MTKNMFTRRIIIYEVIGFGLILFTIWTNEFFDVPFLLLSAEPTPVNVAESIYESVLILLLGFGVVFLTYRLLSRLSYLEGFLSVCLFCKKVRVDEEWVPVDKYIKEHSAAEISHGLCPECYKKHYGHLHE